MQHLGEFQRAALKKAKLDDGGSKSGERLVSVGQQLGFHGVRASDGSASASVAASQLASKIK